MSYYSNMSPTDRKKFYEQQKSYRATKKNLCLVIPKSVYAYINKFAQRLGWSFTKTLMYGSVLFWFSKSDFELDILKDFGGNYEFYCGGATNVHD